MSRFTRLQHLVQWLLPLLTCSCGGDLGSLNSSAEAPSAQAPVSVGPVSEGPLQGSAVPPCSGAGCPVYAVRTSAGSAQPLLGGIGGQPFGAVCREDQVLIGIRALVADDLWGLGVNCGSLELSPSGAGYTLTVLPLDQLSLFGGNGIQPTPPLVEYSCPPPMVVTAVSWTLWQPFVDLQQVIKQMQLTCSELSVGADRQLRAGATTALLAAGMVGESSSPAQQTCSEGAVSGFTGRSGGAIDALSTHCVALSVALE